LKIALVRAKYNPFGGAERFLNDAVAAMQGSDVKFTLFTRAWPAQASTSMEHRIVNPRYLTSAGRDSGFNAAATRAISQEKFDLIQSYERLPDCDIYHAVDGVHAEWLRQRARISSGVKRFGISINPRHRYVLAAERAMYSSPKFKAAICISEMVKADILRHFDVAPEKLHVVYSGIDNAKFSPDSRESMRDATRTKYGIPKSAKVAVFVGSGFERKGLAQFIRALAQPAIAEEKIFGLIVGKDKLSKKYEALATQLGIRERVIFTGGVADTRPFYAASDVFVLPTMYEPFGLVCLEAMAAGLPVITSTTAGAAELVRDGVNGYVCDALDTAAIANAIKNITPAMGAAARDTALTFSPANMAEQYATLYRRLQNQ
jgi:UDP-glucose:(heptosyl)LPS alpha-1,3-glucosyltransferase